MQLTQSDVERLTQDGSEEARAETAVKLAHVFDAGQISDDEKQIAEDIFRVLIDDAAVRVRAALSDSLKHCPHISHDVAFSLANDVNAVALPILQSSQVLTDSDLVAIVNGSDSEKQMSIAKRAIVSSEVSDALVESHNEDVVATLVSNEGAAIREETMGKVLDEFKDSDRVLTPMAYRREVPASVAERLVAMVSDHLREHIATHHALPAEVVSDLLMQSRERATMSLSSENNASELVKTLVDNGRLTPSIITRALCMGDLQFFEWSIAILSKMPIKNARLLIHDKGPLGLKAAFDRSDLPDAVWPIVRAAIDIAHETEYDGAEGDRERYAKRMIERVITHFEHPGQSFDSDNLAYLLNKLTDLTKVAQSAA